MPNQQNPYQYTQIDIQKIIPNPSKSRNPKVGEIENHKITNLRSGAAAPEARWSSSAQRSGGDVMGLGVGEAVLQV